MTIGYFICFPVTVPDTQTQQPNTIQICSLIVLKIRSSKIKALTDCIPYGGLGENSFPWLVQLLEAACIPSFVASFSSLKPVTQHLLISFSLSLLGSIVSLPFLNLTLLPTSYKDSCDYIGITWIIEGDLPITRSIRSHLPFYHVRESIQRFQEFQHGYLGGDMIQSTTAMVESSGREFVILIVGRCRLLEETQQVLVLGS